ncbi:T9SS type A sorting domain-containing protein, partial [Rubrivirga marina]
GVPGYYPAANPPNLWTAYDAVAADWVVSAGTGEALEPGRAFRWRMYDRNVGNPDVSRSVELPFTLSTTLPPNTADVTVELQTGGSRFNYLANPFGVALDVTGVFGWPGGENVAPIFGVEVYDELAASWVAPTGPIAPWESFRVRAKGPLVNGDPRTLTIPYPAAPPVASAREAAEALTAVDRASDVARLPFTVSGRTADGGRLAGSFAVAFTDAARAALDDHDAPATAPLAEAALTAGARVGAGLLAVDARPFAAGEVPLALDARGAARTMTLRWDASALPAGLPVALVDLATGTEVDVRARTSYTFDVAERAARTEAELDGAGELADPSGATDRFVLRVGAAPADAGSVGALEVTAVAPNPSSSTARVAFAVPTGGRARVSVVDVRGREVAVLVDGVVAAGRHEAVLESAGLAAGVYLVRVEAGGRVATRQAAVIR